MIIYVHYLLYIFAAANGEFGSPMENGQYLNNLDCHYLIKMPRNSQSPIKLKFLSFHLEGDGMCPFDYVEVRSKTTENNENRHRFVNILFSYFLHRSMTGIMRMDEK